MAGQRIQLLCFLSALWLYTPAAAETYYAATDGSGAACSQGSPCSLDAGLGKLAAGDTLYLGGGTYRQTVYFSASGAEGFPITISGHSGETAIIDGYDTLPTGEWGALFNVVGDFVVVSDLEIRDSLWMGLRLAGSHDSAVNVSSHGHWENGILLCGDYGLAENCRVYDNCKSNVDCTNTRGNWASGLSAARHPTGCVIRNCTAWNNWGEGISTYESTHTVIEDNVSYDNYSVNLYLSDATDVLCQRNIVYATGAITCGGAQLGIAVSSEGQSPDNADITLINNLVKDTRRNFYYYASDSDGMVNTIIAHNTFVDSTYEVNFKILAGNHSNTIIQNNIIMQDDSIPLCNVVDSPGLTFSYNNWSGPACAHGSGTGDVVGDPRLAETGPTGAGQLTGEYFKILFDSPARDAGRNVSGVTEDYFRTPRPVGAHPDMGGHEYLESDTVRPAAPAGLDVSPP
jgi:hypothetical protein